ncbi:DNA repair family protein [Aspergillus piperis CBS 112811]|uniref:DNA repair family protein n=1 Tax=Aspergillus piperis CBS 112811 TaxID=1448313 RepID=A0A8G1QXH8_9EURO|nr:DNA repair family protein [Aspergillus piperis CBS 112811]RAH56216.1 DNA repair family protein [Aspergillus piperis CBS 112811]
MSKRISTFFQPLPSKKKLKPDATTTAESSSSSSITTTTVPPKPSTYTHHPSYPIPIRDPPSTITTSLLSNPAPRPPKSITNHPHLDLLYFQPFLPAPLARDLFEFLRNELPFYRVQYNIRRGGTETSINTPRYTTVFGVDDTSTFTTAKNSESVSTNSSNPDTKVQEDTTTSHNLLDSPQQLPPANSPILVDSKTRTETKSRYRCRPRPIPPCLDILRQAVEKATDDGTRYNFVLVNYYATGDDSISYHSDDERFLGQNPTIASLSLGVGRDFLLKHKPGGGSTTTDADRAIANAAAKPLKFPLKSGDMLIMRGETQANWLHSVPKRKGLQGSAGALGRINITFRRAVVPGGTENYYRYNVGDGVVYRWKDEEGKMVATTE